jgi:hypothetical protein
MAIDKIGSGARPVAPAVNTTGKVKGSKRDKAERKDSVVLSDEAKMLFAAEKAKKLGSIRAKVKKGFYEDPEVTKRVVEGLIKELKTPPQA